MISERLTRQATAQAEPRPVPVPSRLVSLAARVPPLYVEVAAVLAMAATILRCLLVPPVVGLADQGDFARIMGATGLTYPQNGLLRAPASDEGFLQPTYSVRPTQWWRRPGYVSSELLPVRLAIIASQVISPPSVLDIRTLGAIHTLLFVGSAWLIMRAARALGRAAHLLVIAALVTFGTDIGYFAYFNSLYTEPASLISLYFLVGLALLLVGSRHPTPWHLCGLWVASASLILAKPQNTPLGVVLVPFLAWMQWRYVPRLHRVLRLALPGALLAFTIVAYAITPWNLVAPNLYNAIFGGILAHSPTPARDLEELGLDPALAAYAGTTPWDAGLPTTGETFMRELPRRVNFVAIGLFYARHPDRFVALAASGARFAFEMRVRYLSFERSAGFPAGTHPVGPALWSAAKERLLPRTLPFLAILGLGFAALSGDFWRHSPSRPVQGVAALCGLLVAMAAVQFGVSLLGEGTADLTKHLFLFNVLVDLCLLAAMVWGSWRLRRTLRQLMGRRTALTAPVPASG